MNLLDQTLSLGVVLCALGFLVHRFTFGMRTPACGKPAQKNTAELAVLGGALAKGLKQIKDRG